MTKREYCKTRNFSGNDSITPTRGKSGCEEVDTKMHAVCFQDSRDWFSINFIANALLVTEIIFRKKI